MNKTLIKSESEYKEYAFKTLQENRFSLSTFDALGVSTEGWTYAFNNGPDLQNPYISKAADLILKTHYKILEYPIIAVSWSEDAGVEDADGNTWMSFRQVIVELKEFNTGIMN